MILSSSCIMEEVTEADMVKVSSTFTIRLEQIISTKLCFAAFPTFSISIQYVHYIFSSLLYKIQVWCFIFSTITKRCTCN